MPDLGTRVSVRPGEWQPLHDVHGDSYRDFVVVSVHASLNPSWAWVYGHDVDCTYESADCAQPWCVEVLIAIDVLAAIAAGERP